MSVSKVWNRIWNHDIFQGASNNSFIGTEWDEVEENSVHGGWVEGSDRLDTAASPSLGCLLINYSIRRIFVDEGLKVPHRASLRRVSPGSDRGSR